MALFPVAALIAASGKGRRMKSAVKKQYLPLEGVPVLARSVNRFIDYPGIVQVVVVVAPEDTEQARKILKPFCPLDRLIFVKGGERRQDSVFNGLKAVTGEAELVCIHDGVRPLVTGTLLASVLETARRRGSAVPVIPVTDTIKEVNGDGRIKKTVSRDKLFRVQTPQVFRRDLIKEAYSKALMLGVEATDDAYLLELMGHPVYTVSGDPANIKITDPADLPVAAALLKGEQ